VSSIRGLLADAKERKAQKLTQAKPNARSGTAQDAVREVLVKVNAWLRKLSGREAEDFLEAVHFELFQLDEKECPACHHRGQYFKLDNVWRCLECNKWHPRTPPHKANHTPRR
jgi:hypothetical protein